MDNIIKLEVSLNAINTLLAKACADQDKDSFNRLLIKRDSLYYDKKSKVDIFL